MGKEEDLKAKLFQQIIQYVRDNHAETIDKAYDYFWDEQKPDEVLTGIALELGFINFEDWLVFDYKTEGDTGFLDLFAVWQSGLSEEEKGLLEKIKPSVLSLYEVLSVSKDKHIRLRDLMLDGELSLRVKPLTRGLTEGSLFATRILELDGNAVMSGCAYPFPAAKKRKVLDRMQSEFGRYIRNVNPKGTMRDFLKAYGDIFNLVWLELLTSAPEEKAAN